MAWTERGMGETRRASDRERNGRDTIMKTRQANDKEITPEDQGKDRQANYKGLTPKDQGAAPRREPEEKEAMIVRCSANGVNMEGKGRRRTLMVKFQDRIGMQTHPSKQQLDEELGRVAEREEWRAEQWEATRIWELFNGEGNGGRSWGTNGGKAENGV